MEIFSDIIFYIFVIVGTIHLVHFAAYLVGASVYDAKYFKARSRKYPKSKSSKTYASHSNPLVSVLIPAYNESKVIERSLRSVWNNSYNKVETVVVNDGSRDNTSGVVRSFIAEKSRHYNPTNAKIVRTKNGFKRVWERSADDKYRRIYLIEQRNRGKAEALNNALNSNHVNGELVMTLDADSLLQRDAIQNVVPYFEDKNIAGVAANVRMIEENSILGMLQRFEHMISYRSKKFYTVTNSELIVGGVASTYRKSILSKVGNYDNDTTTEDIGLSMKIAAQGNKKNKLVYAVDVVAQTEPVAKFDQLLSQRYRWKLGSLQNVYKYRSLVFKKDKKFTKALTF